MPLDGEQVVFDTNAEAQGHDFFRVGGMDISKDGRWMLYGADTSGDERYDFRIRDLETGGELEERFEGIGGACFTPDAQWVFYVLLDDAWRPYAVMRHRVGTPSRMTWRSTARRMNASGWASDCPSTNGTS